MKRVKPTLHRGGEALRLNRVSKRFEGIWALNGVSLTASAGSITAVVGPNGAGKTTLFNAVTGLVAPDAGRIYFNQTDVTGFRPERLARIGLARTFQSPRIFYGLSILESFSILSVKPAEARILLETVGLSFSEEVLIRKKAGELSFGQQKLLSMAQSLALRPKILLLDEPFSGIHGDTVLRLEALLLELSRKGTTVLMIEHNMHAVLQLAQSVYVLNEGRNLAEGKPDSVFSDPRIQKILWNAQHDGKASN